MDSTDLILLVMEYAEENLAQIIPGRRLTPEETSQVLDSALDALSYLHGQELVLGDLRPAGIMAIKDQLKLASDCIGKAGEPFPNSEQLSVYDPPEKAGGRTSPAADIWSLGITLVEVLTQRLPTWNRHGQADPVLQEELPAPFSEIVRGCLRRDPGQRLTVSGIKALLHPKASASPSVPVTAAPPMPEKPQPRQKPNAIPAAKPAQAAKPANIWWKSSRTRLIVLSAIFIVFLALLLRIVRTPDHPRRTSAITEPPKAGTPDSKATSDGQQQPIDLTRSAVPSRDKPSPASSSPAAPAIATTGAPANQEVVHEVLPDVSQTARDTIQGTVRVRVKVQVDRAGNVLESNLDSAGPSKYFARLAMQAAQSWKFVPSGQDEKREFLLHFDFTNSGTRASATRAGH